MFTVPCEAISNGHPSVYRSALVGIGDSERRTPVMLMEAWPEATPTNEPEKRQLLDEVYQRLAHSDLTRSILRKHVLLHPAFPVDIRHNAKIFREKLEPWAAMQLKASE